jgi:hypothetical protein
MFLLTEPWLTGRRRIGKATLTDLRQFAQLIGLLIADGYVVILDEFQYFTRKPLRAFASFLQAVVDDLSARAAEITGGLVVLGSIQAEMQALLQNRCAPLYNRTTDEMEVPHLDVPAIDSMLRGHGCTDPNHLLFLWTLFEGVPKFYRDCFEQDVLVAPRRDILRTLFFASSAPLKNEADNWFLKELRGRYDTVLKYIARHPGREYADILAQTANPEADGQETIGAYLKILEERCGMIEARQSLGSKPQARRRRYYLRDHFLQAWLDALAPAVTASHFRPLTTLIAQADLRLITLEGRSFERMVQQLWEALSRRDVAPFRVTQTVCSWWGSHAELDAVAVDESTSTMRIINCKRSDSKILPSLPGFDSHIAEFLRLSRFKGWQVKKIAVAPQIGQRYRGAIQRAGYECYDLPDLFSLLR